MSEYLGRYALRGSEQNYAACLISYSLPLTPYSRAHACAYPFVCIYCIHACIHSCIHACTHEWQHCCVFITRCIFIIARSMKASLLRQWLLSTLSRLWVCNICLFHLAGLGLRWPPAYSWVWSQRSMRSHNFTFSMYSFLYSTVVRVGLTRVNARRSFRFELRVAKLEAQIYKELFK